MTATPPVPVGLPPVVAVVGPTGVGKSDLGVRLAESFDGEVINADAMQVYQGMDIGTAKLSVAQRRGVPHHLLDIWPVTAQANVACYQRMAREHIAEIGQRGRLPVLVGGSGLYISAVIDQLEFPGHDPKLRATLEEEVTSDGPQALHRKLAQVDPEAASRILPTNARRIVRALEVIAVTGEPFRATLPQPQAVLPALIIGVDRPREELDHALEQRVSRMWADGLVAEVAALDGLSQGPTASRAVGYRQVLEHLAGRISADQAQQDTVRATRKLARRQLSWFRRDQRVRWLQAGPGLTERAQMLVAEFTEASATT